MKVHDFLMYSKFGTAISFTFFWCDRVPLKGSMILMIKTIWFPCFNSPRMFISLQILVGGLEHEFYFPNILGISSSQLTNSYIFRGVGQPPASIGLLKSCFLLLKSLHFFGDRARQITSGWVLAGGRAAAERCSSSGVGASAHRELEAVLAMIRMVSPQNEMFCGVCSLPGNGKQPFISSCMS